MDSELERLAHRLRESPEFREQLAVVAALYPLLDPYLEDLCGGMIREGVCGKPFGHEGDCGEATEL
jgi:hypothetical protein